MSEKTRYYRKEVDFFRLLNKIKLWPSRNGVIHGIRSIKEKGNYAEVITHCNQSFVVYNSKNSRAARWLRNKWMTGSCKACKIPSWKMDKFSSTMFTQHYGSQLRENEQERN